MSNAKMVTIVLPVAVDLALAIGAAVCDWHDQSCDVEGCRVWMGGEPETITTRLMTFSHGLPAVPGRVEDIVSEVQFPPSANHGGA